MRIDDTPVSEMTLRQHYAGLIVAATVAKYGCDWDRDQHTEFVQRIADALCRELAKPRVKPPWQPMRTAPKDRRIEACLDGIEVVYASWIPSQHHWDLTWQDGSRGGADTSRLHAWREIETDDTPEQLPTEPMT